MTSRPYNEKTKNKADKIQWTRTAYEIMKDKYVYSEKACSDIALVFIACCGALGIKGRLVKLVGVNINNSHSIAEIFYKNDWYRIDPSANDSVFFEGELNKKSIWNKKFKVWKKGKDSWEMGLYDKGDEVKIK